MTTTEKKNQIADRDLSQRNGHVHLQNQPTFSPRFDIWEGDDELILYGDLPGVEPNSLDINFENRQLTIHGKVCRCHEGNRSLYSEYGIGDFERTFTIGEAINGEGITAEMRDGVLTLHLPKSEASKPRKIEVKAN
ncbi:MAG: Hsp20/alpha crystallin family protein [Aureliella sp.]